MKYLVGITVMFFLWAIALNALTIHVPGDQPTIQEAIDAAADGDTVLIASGTYTGDGNRDISFLGKAILVRSQSGNPEDCIIDCQADSLDPHRGFFFHSDEGPNSMLAGLTIKRAWITGEWWPDMDGGGILCYNSSPTIIDCILMENSACTGGGLYCASSGSVIIGCLFSNNSASNGAGAGSDAASQTYIDCIFSDNAARRDGGGIFSFLPPPCGDRPLPPEDEQGWKARSAGYGEVERTRCSSKFHGGEKAGYTSPARFAPDPPALIGCSFHNNSAGSDGGAINGCYTNIVSCTIHDNHAGGDGGGISFIYYDTPRLENSVLSGNCALNDGGGIYVGSYGSVVMTNCIISENTAQSGGAVCAVGTTVLVNCTVPSNTAAVEGGAIHGSAQIVNSILWGNAPDEISGSPAVSYSDVMGGWAGVGNIDADPRFVPYPFHGFEYLLRPGSPCIDAGDPAIEDGLYDWHPRWPEWYPNGARSDMGAYGGPGNLQWLK